MMMVIESEIERVRESQSQEGKEVHLILHKSNDIILQKPKVFFFLDFTYTFIQSGETRKKWAGG